MAIVAEHFTPLNLTSIQFAALVAIQKASAPSVLPDYDRALLERDDVIIVASVSCIYGIGSVETYTAMTFGVKVGEVIEQRQLIQLTKTR
mgnify:CR=1 FL=1